MKVSIYVFYYLGYIPEYEEKMNKAVTKYRSLASLDLNNHTGRLDYFYVDLGSALVKKWNRD